MPAKTDFNVSPYWDDWTLGDDFYRVLFRPGFAVQARELTTLQTILQNQIEQFGDHMFKHGAQVIPGAVTYDSEYYSVKVQSTYSTGDLISVHPTQLFEFCAYMLIFAYLLFTIEFDFILLCQ